MNIGTILLVIFLPACLSVIYSVIQNSKVKIRKTMTDKNFTVMLPSIFAIIGAVGLCIMLAILLIIVLFSDERPHYISCLCYSFFIWLGVYLIVKTLTFKVVVKGEKITVFSALRKPYSFTFSEIVSAVRQVKKNRVKSERIVIKTAGGKKLIVESAEISYNRFAKRIQAEVDSKYLVGFEEK